jgi:Raf kinase inhibitor-like YbhB/YbcL family protein
MRKLPAILAILAGVLNMIALNSTAEAFTLQTTSFSDQGTLPVVYTCDGEDISPALSWKEAPEKTASLALIVADPDASSGTFYHWVVYNIPPAVTEFARGKLPAGVIEGRNSWSSAQYRGPCPPKGETHHYIFTLYALDNKLTLPPSADAKMVLDAIQSHILAKAELTSLYHRRVA